MTETTENIPDTLAKLVVPIDGLVPYGRNPRRGNVDLIVESLEVHGQYRPIVVRAGSNEVLAGNHTLQAAKQFGWERITVTFVDVDDDTAARIVLVDNRANDVAGSDDAVLAELLDDMPNLPGTGYDDAAVAALLDRVSDDPRRSDEGADEIVEPPADPVTKPGDVWQVGPHRVLCGDCTNAEVVASAFETPPDLILTDPPYCSGGFQESARSSGSVGTTAAHKMIANDTLSTRGYIALMKAMHDARPCEFAYMFTDWRMWTVLFDVTESKGYGVRSMIVWNKGTLAWGEGGARSTSWSCGQRNAPRPLTNTPQVSATLSTTHGRPTSCTPPRNLSA